LAGSKVPIRFNPPVRTWPGYRNATVIDSLGVPGSDDDVGQYSPLTAAEIADVRTSGLTAVNLTVGDDGIGSYAKGYDAAVRSITYWNSEIAAHPDVFLQVRRAADIAEAKRSGRLGLIYGFQDETPIAEDLDRVAIFCDLGVRIFQLTYNLRNLVGEGCLEPGDAGLSRFGHHFVARLNESKALVDLPIAISHTGCAALAPNPRNKTDNELRKLADKGGYVGIYLMPYLRSQGQPMADDLIRHVEHAVDVCGEDHVGIGSDGAISPIAVTQEYKRKFADEINERRKRGVSAPGEDTNVYTFLPDLNSTGRFARIAELLASRNHSEARIEKILGDNFARLLRDVWEG